jgi:hypothetical protein
MYKYKTMGTSPKIMILVSLNFLSSKMGLMVYLSHGYCED